MEAARKAKAEGAVLVIPDVTIQNFMEHDFGNMFIRSAGVSDRKYSTRFYDYTSVGKINTFFHKFVPLDE